MKKSIIFKISVSVLLIIFLFYKIGLQSITETFKTFKIQYIFLAIVFLLLNHLVAIINLKIVSIPIKKVKYTSLAKSYFVSYALGMVSPGRIGEFSIAYLLKKEGFTLGQGFAMSLLDKIITLVCLSLIALFGFYKIFPAIHLIWIIFILVIILACFLIAIFSQKIRIFIRKYVLRKYSVHMKGFSRYFRLVLLKKPQISLLNIIFTFIKWGMAVMILYATFLGFGIKIPFIYVYVITSLVSITSLIPITINGIGLKESLSVLLYGSFGIPSAIVLSSYIISNALQYLFVFILVLFLKLEVKNEEKQS